MAGADGFNELEPGEIGGAVSFDAFAFEISPRGYRYRGKRKPSAASLSWPTGLAISATKSLTAGETSARYHSVNVVVRSNSPGKGPTSAALFACTISLI